jgi:hypothetical protein
VASPKGRAHRAGICENHSDCSNDTLGGENRLEVRTRSPRASIVLIGSVPQIVVAMGVR